MMEGRCGIAKENLLAQMDTFTDWSNWFGMN
jgi:hypothetical protein